MGIKNLSIDILCIECEVRNLHNVKCLFSNQEEEEDELESIDQDDEDDEDEDDDKSQGDNQL